MVLEKKDFILDPCVASVGFEFFSKKQLKLDVDLFAKKAKQNKIFVEKNNSPFFIELKTKFGLVIVYNNLKIIVRVDTKEEANKILEFLLKIINESLQE
jgi:hypothetical protein